MMSDSQLKLMSYSAVIPVGPRADDLEVLVREYNSAFESTGNPYEIIVVLDAQGGRWLEPLTRLCAEIDCLRVIELSREFGESSALAAGFDAARGETLVTLPAYYQIDPEEIPKLLVEDHDGYDMLVAVRPRSGASFDKIRRRAFHALFRFTSGMHFQDLGCGVRRLKREIAEEIPLYGEQHRFFPALARRRGFRVNEVVLKQSSKDMFRGRYRIREYLHRFLDILTVFFLVRFTKKPLRFFGTVGFIAASIGGVFTSVLIVQRLFFDMPLADRPALLLGSLMVVLGVQTFALGLIGELIIFTHARDMKEYTIRRVIQSDSVSTHSEAVEPRISIGAGASG
jgi:glycosyltransferase involved in cell wall biosynthesis